MYSNSCCNCSCEPEIIKIGPSSHKMYSNNILNFPESIAILNASTKKSGNLLNAQHTHTHIYIYIWLGVWVLQHINLCRLFNAKIISYISNNSV